MSILPPITRNPGASIWSTSLVHAFGYRKPELPPSFDSTLQGGIYDWYQSNITYNDPSRLMRYRDYDAMDLYPDLGAFLDLIREDTIQIDPTHQSSVWVDTQDENVLLEAEKVLAALNIDARLPSITRALAKYGDVFDLLFVNSEKGVYGAKYFPPNNVVKDVDALGNLKGYKIEVHGEQANVLSPNPAIQKELQPWEVIHFALPSRNPDSPYGDSLLLSVRQVWKQVKMLEDAIFIYELLRAPDRFLFKIDCGSTSSPEERMRIIKRWRSAYQKKDYRNPDTGEFKSGWSPWAYEDNLYIPVAPGSSSDIIKLPGTVGGRDLGGLDAFRSRIYAGLKVPRVYLSQESDLPAAFVSRQSLAQQDIRYARSVLLVQKAVILGLRRAIDIHLAARGYQLSLTNYQLMMATVSQLAEIQRLEALQLKIGVAERFFGLGMQLGLNPDTFVLYLLSNILGFEDEMIGRIFQPGMLSQMMGAAASGGSPSNVGKDMTPESMKKVNGVLRDMVKEDPKFGERINFMKDIEDVENASRGVVHVGKWSRRIELPGKGFKAKLEEKDFDERASC